MLSRNWKYCFLVATILWAILLVYLHALPGSEINIDGWYLKYHMDKVAHAFMFFVLFVLVYFSFKKDDNTRLKNSLIPMLLIVIFGASMEIMQGTIIADRTADGLDFIADILGVPIGIIGLKVFNW